MLFDIFNNKWWTDQGRVHRVGLNASLTVPQEGLITSSLVGRSVNEAGTFVKQGPLNPCGHNY